MNWVWEVMARHYDEMKWFYPFPEEECRFSTPQEAGEFIAKCFQHDIKYGQIGQWDYKTSMRQI